MTVDVGDLESLGNPSQDTESEAFTDQAGTATDPTAVTLTIRKPDGTRLVYGWPGAGVSGTLTRESAGRFYANVAIDQSGTWQWRLAGTGAVTAASEGELHVNQQRVV